MTTSTQTLFQKFIEIMEIIHLQNKHQYLINWSFLGSVAWGDYDNDGI